MTKIIIDADLNSEELDALISEVTILHRDVFKKPLILQKKDVGNMLPIEEVALHAADDWFDTAKLRSDIRADLKSYYEGYRDAMRVYQVNED